MLTVYIRSDASIDIGSGHVMRCLTLAETLRQDGAKVSFICRPLSGHGMDYIMRKGFTVHCLPEPDQMGSANHHDLAETQAVLSKENHNIDWLIVDHYELDSTWESEMRPFVQHIMVIDDLANRSHDCDILLDPNLHPCMDRRYDLLVPVHCKKLLGPSYVLLRSEFIEAHQQINVRQGPIQRILVSFGGSDITNETCKTLEAIRTLSPSNLAIDIVIGRSNPHAAQIHKMCNALDHVYVHDQTDHMAQLMLHADLSIGGGGGTLWERCFLGLPSLAIITAGNQVENIRSADQYGAVLNMGWYYEVSAENLRKMLIVLIHNTHTLRRMSEAALRIMGVPLTSSIVSLLMGGEREC